jgi:hypothetical protein
MHDGGTKMYMYINEKFICSSEATYGNPPGAVAGSSWKTIVGMSPCRKDAIRVKAGDWLSMVSEYDLKKYPQ